MKTLIRISEILKIFYLSLVFLFVSTLSYSQQLFDSTALEQVLYQDAAHAYDDPQVILLSKKREPVLRSKLIPVQAGDEIELSTFVHYSSASARKTWKKIGATVAGLAIGSLPYLLNKNGESVNQQNDLLKKVAPLAGAGVVALPFVTQKRKGKAISRDVSFPKSKNGIFVPDAYLKYNLYDSEGVLLKTDYQNIDKQAKDAWQKLYLYEEVEQDGYVQIELGNSSKKPVWMDGVHLATNTNINAKSTDSRIDTTSVKPDKPKDQPLDVPRTTGECDSDNDSDCIPQNVDEGEETNREGYMSGSGTANDPYVYNVDIFYTYPSSGTLTPITGNYYYYTGGYVGNKYYGRAYYHVSTGGGGSGGSGGGGGGNNPQPIDEGVDPPARLNWNNLSDKKKAQHMIDILAWANCHGNGEVDMNDFFYNIPTTGNYGLGGFYEITTQVSINGNVMPIKMVIPILSNQRIFHVYPLAESDTVVGEDIGSAYLYGYGLNGSNLNLLSVYIPINYDSEYNDFISC